MNLTVRDVARLLNVAERTVYRWIDKGQVPVYRVRDQYRFNRSELLEWATLHRHHVSPELFAEPESAPLASLKFGDALRAGGIYYRVTGADKPSVLRAVVDLLRVPEDVDRGWLFEMLMAREALGSTAIGDGLAIPHVRHPIVLRSPHPSVSLCFLEQPIDFGALDGRPVGVLFTLVSPSVRVHLRMLSRMTYLLRDNEVQKVLETQALRDEILVAVDRVEARLPETKDRSSRSP